MMMKKTSWPMLVLLLCLMKSGCSGQSDPSSRTDGSAADGGSWWRTTPFASLPGMTTQQVLRSILPPDVIPYTPVSSPEETAGYIRDYVSTFKMQSRGMEHLHTYTNMFMALIMPKHLVPPGIQLSTEPELMLDQAQNKWQVILKHYAGVVAVAAIGLLLAAIIPIAGVFVCCCRCAGRCGAKEEPFEKRGDKCQRVILGLFLGVLLLLVAFGIICAFVSNANAQDGVNALPTALRHTTEDTATYFNHTRKEYVTLLTTNYRELEAAIAKALDDSGRLVTNELKHVSRAIAVDNLTAIVSNLAEIRQNLANIEQDTGILQDRANQLQDGLLEVKRQLKQLLDRCASQPICANFRQQYDLDSLSVDLQFQEFVENYLPKLPDVQRIARNISQLITTGVESEVKRGRSALERISNDVQRAVGSTLPSFKQHLRSAGQSLERNSEDISILMGRGVEMARSESIQESINTLQSYIDHYGQYRFYIDIGIASLVLLITLCFAFGLLCGCCGKRPVDRYDDDFGTRATGASCLMSGVGLVFMTSFVLLVLTVVHFLVGVFGQNLSCEVLTRLGTGEEPQQRELYDFIDRNIPLTALNPHGVVKDDLVTVSNIVKECHQNKTLYQMLKLERVLNVSSLGDPSRRLNIESEVRRLTSNIRFNGVNLLSVEAKQQLRDFAASDLMRVNFTAYSILLEQNITSVNLQEMAAILNNTAVQVQQFEPNAANTLWDNAIFLSRLQKSELIPMKEAAQRLRKAAANLEERVRFNQSSLSEAIEMLIGQAESAQTFLENKGPEQLSKLAVEFAKECERLIDQYVQRVTDHVLFKVGKCWPLSQAYNTTSAVICQQIFWPFNGFWASVGWCCLLFLPCVVLAMVLASLYRKTDPYPGSIVEREYLYDAYADRDNIPLALNNRDRRGIPVPSNTRSGHAYGHVYGGAYEDDYSISQHQARTGNGSASNRIGVTSSASSGGGGVNSSTAVVAPSERNGKTPGRFQDPAPRAWGDGSVPRYVASPTHATAAAATATSPSAGTPGGGTPSAPSAADYERPPPYYYPGPADK
ncbi:prominin-like protein isoform X1 [Daphnia pulicaria]|uniref:prominin-like protein isoform X1 n=1 Tax=Daphnia pulicaria TaxID=35523 RepID=UPI001EEA8306|nr:prominin-like protein isoform X1 [Daphnia pulicaria]